MSFEIGKEKKRFERVSSSSGLSVSVNLSCNAFIKGDDETNDRVTFLQLKKPSKHAWTQNYKRLLLTKFTPAFGVSLNI